MYFCSLREDNFYTTDENHNDLIQDVLDVNVLLCKLKSILMEVGAIVYEVCPICKFLMT